MGKNSMNFTILGLGTAVPSTVVDQATASRIAQACCCRTAEQQTWVPTMYVNSGIRQRHMVMRPEVVRDVLEGTRTSQSPFLPSGADDDNGPTTAQRMRAYAVEAKPIALAAARQALDRAEVSAAGITHLVTVSCTGCYSPGLDIELIQELALPADAQRTHIGFMGCHGALNGLRVARAFATAEPDACVLLCATELCSLHYHYGWDPQKVIANAIFADGAAALVGAASSAFRNGSRPTKAWHLAASGSCLFPGSGDAMTWTIGDHGFEMTLSKKVPALIAAHLRPWLQHWLDRNFLSLDAVASWAVHPGGPRIVDAVEEALGLSPRASAASRSVLAEHGNMSSPTILFILDRLRQQDAAKPCVALGFGPGLAVEAALFR
jgi:predicted naringenin-chalcone synthase